MFNLFKGAVSSMGRPQNEKKFANIASAGYRAARTSASVISQDEVLVYVWRQSPSDPGHVAIRIGKNHYGSIHPKYIGANPLPIPLTAALMSNATEDNELRGEKKLTFSEPDAPPSQIAIRQEPDAILNLSGLNLDTNAMKQHIEESRVAVEEGRLYYQLVPRIKTCNLFPRSISRQTASHLTSDPFSELADDFIVSDLVKSKIHGSITAENCTSFVASNLKAGGKEISAAWRPWFLTPAGLEGKLLEMGATVEEDVELQQNVTPSSTEVSSNYVPSRPRL